MTARCLASFVALVGAALIAATPPAHAEVTEIRIAQQYGINYLTLMVMEDRKLVETEAKRMGLGDVTVSWPKMSSGAAMNDALLSGNLEVASGGVGPIVVLWAKSRDNLGVRAISALNSMPVVLNTRNPAIKSLKDFTSADKIALPAVKVSIQAVTLQMAAAQAFGPTNYDKLDSLTVAMSHPDGMIALIGGQSEVDAHFTGPPFSELEAQKPGIHTVVNSYQVLGGKTTSTLAWCTSKFRRENPKTFAAILAAIKDATDIINADKHAAAVLYLRMTGSKQSVESLQAILADPDIEYTLTPQKIKQYADFMQQVGSIKVKPDSWKDLFFPEIYDLPGS
ncbi:MAG: ABC transporter substrate-binding protein [Casimicrobiaceae bacterium]